MKHKHLLIWVLLLLSLTMSAQRYPIKVIPQVIPPAPVNFYSYADGSTLNSPLRVQLLLGDLAISNRQIRLKVYFEGHGINIEGADNVVGAQPLFIDGGTPLILTNTELAPYFELQNLKGISSKVYGETIPEGSYQFCFEVYDVVRGIKLGDKTCATTFIFKNEPPFLNLPLNTSNIEPQPVDNIVFQWMPRHINVSNVAYELSIVEIWDDHVDPQTAFLSSPPVFQTTTRSTSFIYGPAQPLLLSNKRYAWQIQAKALKGTEEIGLFKNEGKSEIFWFSKTEACNTPLNVYAEPKGLSKMNVYWDEDPAIYSEYTIAYREKGRDNARWFTKVTNAGWATIWDLKPGTTYEYKVKGKCKFQYSAYTQPEELTTETAEDPSSNYNCGIVPDAIAITNREGNPNILIGDRITAGDFVVTITDITNEANGIISGSGFVRVPYFEMARFGVVFNNILVNTEYQLAEGEIVTLYDPMFGEGAQMVVDIDTDIGTSISGDQGGLTDREVNFVIERVEINEFGAIVVKGTQGEEEIIRGDREGTITDSEGTPWTVGEDGTVTKGEAAEGGQTTTENTTGINQDGSLQITATGVRVNFEPSGFYFFDAVPKNASSKLKETYQILNTPNGDKYPVPYKAIGTINGHETDYIEAKATFTESSITKEDIIFKTKAGVKINASWNGDVAKLELQKKFDYAVEDIIATVKSKDSTHKEKQDIAGVFSMVHLASQEVKDIKVVVVPINNATLSANLEADINAIYNKAGVNLSIETANSLTIKTSDWDINGNGKLDIGDSSLLAQYTEEERAINNFFKAQGSYESKAYYIFVTNIETNHPAIQGFMPLKRQYGFAFGATKQAKTIAHELGHGIFGLEHPFTEYGTKEGETSLLMDNGSGTVLNHLDWKKLHAPGLQLYPFQGDEDGEQGGNAYKVDAIVDAIAKNSNNKNFVFDNTDGKYKSTRSHGDLSKIFKYNGKDYSLTKLNISFGEKVDLTKSFIEVVDNSSRINISFKNASGQIKANLEFSSLNNIEGFSQKVGRTGILNTASELVIKELRSLGSDLSLSEDDLSEYTANCILLCRAKELKELDIDTRISSFSNIVAEDANWRKNEHNLLAELLQACPSSDNEAILQRGFAADNFRWIRQMTLQLAEFTDFSNEEDLVVFYEVSKILNPMITENFATLGIQKTISQMVDLDIEGLSTYDFYPGEDYFYIGAKRGEKYDIFPEYSLGFINSKDAYTIECNQKSGKVKMRQDYVYHDTRTMVYAQGSMPPDMDITSYYNAEFNPFEPVTIIFAKNYPTLGYNAGDTMVIPAYMALLLNQSLANEDFNKNVRLITNSLQIAAAIATVPFSGGSSLAVASVAMARIAGVVATADIGIQSEKHSLTPQEYTANRSYYEAWDTFKYAVEFAELGAGGAIAAIKLPNTIRRLNQIRSWKRFNVICRSNARNLKTNVKNGWEKVKSGYISKANAGGDILAGLKNKLKLPDTQWEKFVDDFGEHLDVLKKFDDKPELVGSWRKLDELGFSQAARRNIDNLNQRSIIDNYADNIASASNARKGNFGEIGADLDLNGKGYESLQPRITDIDAPGHNGIDGVYRKNGDYFIVEGKYTGSASLNPASGDLPRQMSDDWIQRPGELANAVGDQQLAQTILNSDYKRVLAKVAPDGSVTYRLIDEDGYVIRGAAGDFNP